MTLGLTEGENGRSVEGAPVKSLLTFYMPTGQLDVPLIGVFNWEGDECGNGVGDTLAVAIDSHLNCDFKFGSVLFLLPRETA